MINFTSELKMAALNLQRNGHRTLIAILSVAAGVVAYMLASGFIEWIFHDMREATIHSQLGHIQITRPGYLDEGIANPYSYLLPANSKEQKLIEQTRGVKTLSPRLAFSGLLSHGDATIPFIGEGIEPQSEAAISTRMNVIYGTNLELPTELNVLLGEGLARSIGAKIGDSVVLLVTSAKGSPNAVELKVGGVFATITKDYDDNALRIPIDVAQRLMRVEGATMWVALLDDTNKTDQFATAFKVNLPESAYELIKWNDLADFYNKTVVLFSKQVDVVKLIIAMIIILTISNTQTMSVLERTTEIGTSLAIGLKRRDILRLFLLEGVLIGSIGGTCGLLLGFAFAQIISAIGIPMPPPPGMTHGYTGQILITANLASDSLILAILTTLLASLMPAWKASQLSIVEALRCNQ